MMNPGLWIARKNYLFSLMKKVSDLSGGDDPEFVKQSWNELLESYPEEKIEEPIACYKEIALKLEQLKTYEDYKNSK